MNVNTAIFYDMEYLLGSKGNSSRDNDVSIQSILNIIQSKVQDQICIQKAYANWWDSRFNSTKTELMHFGITPVQKFGFGPTVSRNISRVQLVMDALSVALTNSNIKRIVIVSGESMMGALSNRLKEYGISVVCCAYNKHKEKIACNLYTDTIWLENPSKSKQSNLRSTDPIVFNFQRKFEFE